ncbi:ABL004Wp [Eremothecium gossypii ATCC 10895]|uniref:ABL004Wp n=1 Tax=Eremothecium gossypii (strain ATCC 10895 / CBS 109.51 / FGSC 9923 / NRRL Y-1056) TaxID=284811 RepID=Q75DM1_EREGS|nr:ABL004Wp [Eremothecium gossypii ATCC 10895]AAS50767.1 ABL004Wp [Eremothecium gossypii ATCC 10895]AEY95056.1 FABL004Wp [Eremothecium gossypii FDAG1]
MASQEEQLASFQRCLQGARKILCIVGAGLSASSGLTTFQAAHGEWRGHSALELATPEAFQENPELVWVFYSARRYTAMKARPNNGHFALAELCRRVAADERREILLVTQNVDGLHWRAGQPEASTVELHGSVFDYRCTEFLCSYRGRNVRDHFLTAGLRAHTPRELPRPAAAEEPENKRAKHACEGTPETLRSRLDMLRGDLPRCPRCRVGLLRPGVVWCGESLSLVQMDRVDAFLSAKQKVDLVLVIGTSGRLWPAMGYVERAQLCGSRIAFFNTDIEDAAGVAKNKRMWAFQGNAAELLPQALEPVIGRHYKPRGWS